MKSVFKKLHAFLSMWGDISSSGVRIEKAAFKRIVTSYEKWYTNSFPFLNGIAFVSHLSSVQKKIASIRTAWVSRLEKINMVQTAWVI